MRGPRQREIVKPGTPDHTSIRSSGYSSSSSVDSRGVTPDRKRRIPSAGYSSRQSSAAPSPVPRSPRLAWLPPQERITVDTNPLAFTCYQGSRNLHPERLPSRRKERTTALRIWENSRSSMLCIKELSPGLIRLDLRKMKLGSVRGDLVNAMECLQSLNLGNNDLVDKSFDKECKNLATLVELRLDDNQLSVFPKPFCINTLRRISIARNQLQSLQGFETMKKLQIVVVEGNRIKIIDREFFQTLRKLEVLYFSQNQIKEIPTSIRMSKNLRVLDLSGNNLTTIPGDVLRLPGLVDLNLSGNKISRLPTFGIGSVPKRSLQNVDLSDNQLARFPDYLMFITENLDLNKNNIKMINAESFLSLQDEEKALDVTNNPVVVPPPNICQCGFRAMVRFFQEKKVNGKTYHGLKVYIIGSYMSGKTSMLQSMLDQQSRLEGDYERTNLVDIVNMPLTYIENDEDSMEPEAKALNLSCWDFSGNTFYQYAQHFFLQDPSLIILTVNMATYSKNSFYNSVGVWLEWLFSKSERISMIVVGTKSDCVDMKDFYTLKSEIMEHIHEYFDKKFHAIEEEIHNIECKPHISAALSEQLKAYRNLMKLKDNLNIYFEVMATSAKTMHGLEELRNLIQKHIRNNAIFPKVMELVPALWSDVESFVSDHGNKSPFPILPWPRFLELIVNKFGMKNAIQNVAAYLQDVGKILYIPNSITFSSYVVLRPSFVVELLRNLYRDNMEDGFEVLVEALKKLPSSTPAKIERMREDFTTNGVVDRKVLQVMWSFVSDDNVDRATNYLMAKFGIGYQIGARAKDGKYVLTVLTDEDPHGNERPESSAKVSAITSAPSVKDFKEEFDSESRITRILIPWMLRTQEPETYRDQVDETDINYTITAVFRFPQHMPVGLFERLTVKIHINSSWRFLEHWNHGIMAKHLTEKLLLFVLRQPGEQNECLIKLEVRHLVAEYEDDEDRVVLNEMAPVMWQAMLPVIQEMERYLEGFPGAFFQRCVYCPMCHDLSFIGEWMAPKELQCIPSKRCVKCQMPVPTPLLVPLKEKQGLDLAQIRRERRLRREQNERLKHAGTIPGEDDPGQLAGRAPLIVTEDNLEELVEHAEMEEDVE